MKQYHDMLRRILSEGVRKDDRTGTGTLSVFGHQAVFNLADGFPLVTTKRLHLKSIIGELLWFLSGSTNNNDLLEYQVSIWDEWRRPYNFNRPLIEIDRILFDEPFAYDGDFSLAGLNIVPGSVDSGLFNIWSKMMRRCYDVNHHRYEMYGGRGVSVHSDWHDPVAFVVGVKRIPHWEYRLKDGDRFELDKDYFGSNVYGPNTSVWLRTDENNMYTRSAKPVAAISPDGTIRNYICMQEAARRLGIASSTFSRFMDQGVLTGLKGANKQWTGWSFFEYPAEEGKLLRLALIEDGDLGPIYGKQWRSWSTNDGGSFDQIYWLLNELRTNPDSRRLVVSAWNVADLPDMALAPCHCLFQFNTRMMTLRERAYAWHARKPFGAPWIGEAFDWDRQSMGLSVLDQEELYRDTPERHAWMDEQGAPSRYLDCQLYQRSADVFLGVPFNIASYALLTHMVAAQVGMEPGKFVHTFGDLHLYANHIEQAKEQLGRDFRPLPRLLLNPGVKDLFSYSMADIAVENYDPHPAIRAPVAV